MPDITIKNNNRIVSAVNLRRQGFYDYGKSCKSCIFLEKDSITYARIRYYCTNKKSKGQTRLCFICDNYKAPKKKKNV